MAQSDPTVEASKHLCQQSKVFRPIVLLLLTTVVTLPAISFGQVLNKISSEAVKLRA